MPGINTTATLTGSVLAAPAVGVTHVPAATTLTSLNYFDGRFLRAEDFQLEQRYARELVALSNQGGGSGVVHGFTVAAGAGDQLDIAGGLAISPEGRVLYMPDPTTIALSDLIERSTAEAFRNSDLASKGKEFEECTTEAAPPPTQVGQATDYWVLVVGPATVLCGEEVVYGRLCDDACTSNTEHNHRVDALAFRVVPVSLDLPDSSYFGNVHLRSRVASAFFARERFLQPNLISAAGLRSPDWCEGAEPATGADVPLALIARSGAATLFVDMWTARRERLEPPAMVHWQQRMRMRPLDAFFAQINQFQCQLGGLASRTRTVPAGPRDQVVVTANPRPLDADRIEDLLPLFSGRGGRSLADKQTRTATLGTTRSGSHQPGPGQLMDRGVVELPPAGWLPVVPGLSVEPQIAELLGSSVDVRFCAVRHDFPPEAFWEAQHLERIPLWTGLENPQSKPEIDVLVPDPETRDVASPTEITAYATQVVVSPDDDQSVTVLSGVSRMDSTNSQIRLAMAAAGPLADRQSATGVVRHLGTTFIGDPSDVFRRDISEHIEILDSGEELLKIHAAAAAYLENPEADRPIFAIADDEKKMNLTILDVSLGGNPLLVSNGGVIPLSLDYVHAFPSPNPQVTQLRIDGRMRVTGRQTADGVQTVIGEMAGTGRVDGGTLHEFKAGLAVAFSSSARESSLTIRCLPEVSQLDGLQPLSIKAVWAGSPTEAKLEVAVGRRPLAAATLVGSAAALLDGNPFHDRAEAAIDAASAILRNRSRAAELARFILGRGISQPATRSLLPTRDWVMFHRRRPIECDLEQPPAPPEEPPEPVPSLEQVDLVGIFPKSAAQMAEIQRAIVDGSLTLERAQTLRPIDFLEGTGIMVTPESVVKATVVDASQGGRKPAAYAYVGADSGQRAARIAEFADALEIASGDITLISEAATDRGYPDAKEVVVVLMSPPEVDEDPGPATATHVVIDAPGADPKELVAVIKQQLRDGVTIEQIIRRAELEPMGKVTFVGNAVAKHTLPRDRTSNQAEAYVLIASDAPDLDDATIEQRAIAIAKVIGRPVAVSTGIESRKRMQMPVWIVTRQRSTFRRLVVDQPRFSLRQPR